MTTGSKHGTQPVRLEQSLDGLWELRLDPHDRGLDEGWHSGLVAFDRQVPVPGAWQVDGDERSVHAGVAWYHSCFEAPRHWPPGRVGLRFGAVDHSARAWLNGMEVGAHVGGYLPFEFAVDDQLRQGENELIVRVEDVGGDPDRPRGKQGGAWYTPTSGIWQSVTLTWRRAEAVDRLACLPAADLASVRVRGTCMIDAARTLVLEVADRDGELAAREAIEVSPGSVAFDVRLPIPAVRPWEPADPHLYTLTASLDAPGRDRATTQFGMRTIEARDGGIWFNGHRQELRGALDQAFWPNTLYVPPSTAALADEIRAAKALGFNLLRKHIKVEDPRALDLADELGVFIWAEPPNPQRFTAASAAAVRRDLLGMIERDVNHPSIVVWGCYNEDWGIEDLWNESERQGWLRGLVAEVHALDPTRLVCDNSGWAHVSTDLNDYHEYFSLPDRSAAFEARLDELERDPDDNFAAGHAAAGQPVVVSEIGAWMLPDPAAIAERLGGAPRWFRHADGYQRVPGEDGPADEDPLPAIATIAGFAERLAQAGLDYVFETPAAVAAHARRRGARSMAAQLEAMRRRPAVAGYVVTELTDTEWEANGWLDHWRTPKPIAPVLAAANGALAVLATPDRRVVGPGDTVRLDVSVVNDTPGAVDAVLVIRGPGAGAHVGARLAVAPWSRLDRQEVRWSVPDGPTRPLDLAVALERDGVILAESVVELARVAPGDLRRPVRTAIAPMLERIPRMRLERAGYRIRSGDRAANLAIVDRLDARSLEFASAGGRVLHIAAGLADPPDPLGAVFRALPLGESWEMHTGVAWARDDLLRPAPVRRDLGWEVADWFPHAYVLADSLRPDDVQLAGWFEGWGAFAGAFAVIRPVGQGHVLTTTFRLAAAVGVDPVATLLIHRFVDLLDAPPSRGARGSGWPAEEGRP